MNKLLVALAMIAGTMLIGMSPASADAPAGQFKTNRTVSVKAGETVTHTTSCNESSSHPGPATAAGGSAEFNETGADGVLSVVSEGITEDGTGYFTQVKNTADRGYAYLSWAVCDPIPAFESYTTTVCWQMNGTANDEGYSWPQTRLPNCNPVPKCEETISIQKDVYLIENADEKAYLEGLQSMNGPEDDQRLITENGWSLVILTGDECEVDVPPVDVPPVDVPPATPPVDVPPVVVPPVVTPPVVVAPPVVEVVTPPAVVKVETPPATVKLVTTPTPTNLVEAPVSQPVQEQGFLPNTGGPNALYIAAGAILLAMGSLIAFLARRDRV